MIASWPTKDPNSNLRYWFDWSEFATDEDSDVTSYALSVDNPPDDSLLLGGSAIDGNIIMVWISGGTAGEVYNVRCRVTLANGTIEDESRALPVRQH